VATLATATVDNPTGYGRIVRTPEGAFQSIVEQKNATKEQRAINEVYPSYAVFNVPAMLGDLEVLPRDEVSGEYYLTTVPERLATAGGTVSLVPGVDSQDMLSINTPEQLAVVDGALRNRLGMEVKA
jgi:bifunctional UDP-N-acetylglucosamine pyrophosphorylase/glucosamine-1-phosphate N-acetyltransferase